MSLLPCQLLPPRLVLRLRLPQTFHKRLPARRAGGYLRGCRPVVPLRCRCCSPSLRGGRMRSPMYMAGAARQGLVVSSPRRGGARCAAPRIHDCHRCGPRLQGPWLLSRRGSSPGRTGVTRVCRAGGGSVVLVVIRATQSGGVIMDHDLSSGEDRRADGHRLASWVARQASLDILGVHPVVRPRTKTAAGHATACGWCPMDPQVGRVGPSATRRTASAGRRCCFCCCRCWYCCGLSCPGGG